MAILFGDHYFHQQSYYTDVRKLTFLVRESHREGFKNGQNKRKGPAPPIKDKFRDSGF